MPPLRRAVFTQFGGKYNFLGGIFSGVLVGNDPDLAMFHVKHFCATMGGKGWNEGISHFGLIFVLTKWDGFATGFPGKMGG